MMRSDGARGAEGIHDGVKRHWKRWTLLAAAVAVLLFVVAPFVYINVVEGDAPERLTVSSAPSAAASGLGVSADGTWRVGTGSQAGYRVKEVLFGQDTEAVGRTGEVTGGLTVAGTDVTEGSFTVGMASVASDQERRDAQFRGRIMDVASHPRATFTLTEPIRLGAVPAVGAKITGKATGTLTLKAVTRTVTFEVTASRTGDGTFEVSGQIPVTFADWKIANPSVGPIKVEDRGQVEFLLKFTRKA